VDESQNVTVVWPDPVSGYFRPYQARCVGGAWKAPAAIPGSFETQDATPAVTYAQNVQGIGVGVWLVDRTGAASGRFQANLFNGVAWGSASNLQDLTERPALATSPAATIDSTGRALAVWTKPATASAPGQVHAARNTSGAWSTPTRLGTSTFDESNHRLAGNAQGQAVAAWLLATDASKTYHDLRVSRFDPSTGTWTPATSVEALDTDIQYFNLAMDSQGNPIVVWSQPYLVGSVYRYGLFASWYR
jgi:hypothetical protein